MGQVGHALLTRSPLSPRQQAARDPVRLACVKHAASVHPEPESNPPQKTFMESQQTALKKKKDGPSLKERTVTQKPRHPSNPLGYHTGGHRTGNQEPQATPTRMRPMASSTVHTIEFSNHQTQPANTPGTNPSRSPTGSKMNNLHEPQPKRKPTPTTHPQNPTNTTHPPACHTTTKPTSTTPAGRLQRSRPSDKHITSAHHCTAETPPPAGAASGRPPSTLACSFALASVG